jgi:hypothetical protein
VRAMSLWCRLLRIDTGVVRSPAKSGEIPALSRNGDASPPRRRGEPGRLVSDCLTAFGRRAARRQVREPTSVPVRVAPRRVHRAQFRPPPAPTARLHGRIPVPDPGRRGVLVRG